MQCSCRCFRRRSCLPIFLMCFFHVMKKVQAAIKSFPAGISPPILREIYDLHFVRSKTGFMVLRYTMVKRWSYLTPSGIVTNIPAKTFSAVLKRDYTLWRRLMMDSLLRELSTCWQDQSSSARAFEFEVCSHKPDECRSPFEQGSWVWQQDKFRWPWCWMSEYSDGCVPTSSTRCCGV